MRFLSLETHVTIPESPFESDHDESIIKPRDRSTHVLFPMAWLRVCEWCVSVRIISLADPNPPHMVRFHVIEPDLFLA